MTLLERYKSGHMVEVYQSIYALGEKALEPAYFNEVEKVLEETFKRVKYNLEIIYAALLEFGYKFRTEFAYRSEEPITKPLKNHAALLSKLDKIVEPFGYVPISLKFFYSMVGSCNFTWDYKINENFIWHYADPMEIIALDDLLEMMVQEEWKAQMAETIEEGNNPAYIEFSGDYYAKDNVSGGQMYALEVTKKPSIDSRVLFDDRETSFINYLRLYFENCGFMKITYPEHGNDYAAFFHKVRPQLKKI